MGNVNNVISFEQLVRDFDSLFKHRVFRLETLDYYYAENEREPYARFLAGQPADWTWREPWKRLVRETCASGRIMQRVHVVSEPVSDYIRFELLRTYPANTEAGEDVRVLGRATADARGLVWADDFWLFDDDRAAVLIYDTEGRVERVEMHDEPRLIPSLCDLRDWTLSLAIPLARYVTEHNITERKHAA